jgi:hypothetical protein
MPRICEAQPQELNDDFGKAEPYRTEGGKAARSTGSDSYLRLTIYDLPNNE